MRTAAGSEQTERLGNITEEVDVNCRRQGADGEVGKIQEGRGTRPAGRQAWQGRRGIFLIK